MWNKKCSSGQNANPYKKENKQNKKCHSFIVYIFYVHSCGEWRRGGASDIWHRYGIVCNVHAEWPLFQRCQVYDWPPFFQQKVYDWPSFSWLVYERPHFFWHPGICTYFSLSDFWGCLVCSHTSTKITPKLPPAPTTPPPIVLKQNIDAIYTALLYCLWHVIYLYTSFSK